MIKWILPAWAVLSLMACSRDTTARSWIDRPWEEDVIYFMMTDRFHDGDPENNEPAGVMEGIYDPKQENIDLYHGGDFRGIEKALLDGYFNDLGVTAIWITPPLKNAWYTRYDLGGAPKTGYHGYWTQDFLDIDPHLTSARRLDGTPYPEGREGRLQHYRDLVALARTKGIKIIQDVVCNHAGPVFFYDLNGNDRADGRGEWMPPYRNQGSYHEAIEWGNDPSANQARVSGPMGRDTLFGRSLKTTGLLTRPETYLARGFNDDSLGKSDGEEKLCDFFTLRAIDTQPGADHFKELVDEFVEIYGFYVEEIGVAGFRIDTVKHVHKEFWDAFIDQLFERLGDDADKFFICGEVYNNSLQDISYYGKQSDDGSRAYDGLLNFQFTHAIRNYLRHEGHPHAGSLADFFNRVNDELTSSRLRQLSVNFIGNHDGINRFQVSEVAEDHNQLALAIMLTSEGIPCLYYGSELALHDPNARPGQDSETGRLTLFDNRSRRTFANRRSNDTFEEVAALIRLRAQHPALVTGKTSVLDLSFNEDAGHDDGIIAFTRGETISADKDSICLVIANAGDKPLHLSAKKLKRAIRGAHSLGQEPVLQIIYGGDGGTPTERLTLPANSLQVYLLK
jgi:alpha-amylase